MIDRDAVERVVERLRSRLPVCPFDPKAPKHELEASDPCPICNDYGDERSKNLCRGADTRVMDEAADLLETLIATEQTDDACPDCEGGGRFTVHSADAPMRYEYCTTCGGTGQVAAMPTEQTTRDEAVTILKAIVYMEPRTPAQKHWFDQGRAFVAKLEAGR